MNASVSTNWSKTVAILEAATFVGVKMLSRLRRCVAVGYLAVRLEEAVAGVVTESRKSKTHGVLKNVRQPEVVEKCAQTRKPSPGL